MQPVTEPPLEITELRAFARTPVRVRLDDASEHTGVLRTELLSDKSISVYLAREGGEGATIYIDDIVGIWPVS